MSLSDLVNRDLQLWRNDQPIDPLTLLPQVDSFGQPVFELALIGVVSGRIVPMSDREGTSAEGTRAIVSQYDCILDEPIEVNERDTIVDDGEGGGIYEVDQSAIADDFSGPHHTELVLTKVTA